MRSARRGSRPYPEEGKGSSTLPVASSWPRRMVITGMMALFSKDCTIFLNPWCPQVSDSGREMKVSSEFVRALVLARL